MTPADLLNSWNNAASPVALPELTIVEYPYDSEYTTTPGYVYVRSHTIIILNYISNKIRSNIV